MILNHFLIWIFCVGLTALIAGFLIRHISSGFEGFQAMNPFQIKACPETTTSYTDSAGNIMCCEGALVNGACQGKNVCTMSASGDGIDNCSEWMQKEWASRATKFCPKQLPNYFGTFDGKSKTGCTDSAITSDGSGPSDLTMPTCKMYASSDDELGRKDSCVNIKKLDDVICPTKDSVKSTVYSGKEDGKLLPALFACSYVPPGEKNVMPVVCYDRARAEDYMRVKIGGEWEKTLKEKGIDIDKMLSLCPVSQKYYVDNAIEAKQLKL